MKASSLLAWGLCVLVLLAGVWTARLSSANRARGDELDQRQRWCEAQARRNELARLANQRREWDLLGQGPRTSADPRKELAP